MNGCSPDNQTSTTHPLAPTAIFATHYKMDHPKRGMALIFDHEVFLNSTLTKRKGTHRDCNELKKTLKKFAFDVTVYHDKKYAEMAKIFKTGKNYQINWTIFVSQI